MNYQIKSCVSYTGFYIWNETDGKNDDDEKIYRAKSDRLIAQTYVLACAKYKPNVVSLMMIMMTMMAPAIKKKNAIGFEEMKKKKKKKKKTTLFSVVFQLELPFGN
ncbi:hypothetical protein BLOT_003137 [Blomia tropicalis]|nr:hypothetical protein BLOT_003137 [Blomia tropicalis]